VLWHTHTIVYSRVNQHLYVECADGTGTLEWNTANDTLVKFHNTLIGVVTGAPADDMIFVGNQGESLAVLVQPGKNGLASAIFATLQVPYNPIYSGPQHHGPGAAGCPLQRLGSHL